MKTITSTDGTKLACWRSGEGPPLVLVHGTSADHSRWSPVLPAFEQSFTVYTMDRRGRGGSGDADGYAIEREFEDVASVVDSIGEPVHLLGHSYGALCSLEGALLTRNVRKLVLYEPPVDVTGERINPPGVIDRMEAMLEAGDREGIVTTLMRELAGLPPEAIEHLRSLPAWRTRLDAAHTIPREARAEEAYRFDPDRFADFVAPTLLLLGSESPAAFEEAEKAVDEALPDSRIVVMDGQGHAAIDTGTDLFTAEVLRFLTDGAQQAPPQPRLREKDSAAAQAEQKS